jgi:hypothetical protein
MTPGTQALDHLMDILLVWKMNPAQRKTSERAEELGRCVDNLCGAGVAGNRGRRIRADRYPHVRSQGGAYRRVYPNLP